MKAPLKNSDEGEQARIETHGAGLGVPTRDDLDIRARELAEIDGREQVSKADRERAWRELHDTSISDSMGDTRSDVIASSNPADIAVETGHRVADVAAMDEQRMTQIEVEEGVREAEHEHMLEAQRNRRTGDQ